MTAGNSSETHIKDVIPMLLAALENKLFCSTLLLGFRFTAAAPRCSAILNKVTYTMLRLTFTGWFLN